MFKSTWQWVNLLHRMVCYLCATESLHSYRVLGVGVCSMFDCTMHLERQFNLKMSHASRFAYNKILWVCFSDAYFPCENRIQKVITITFCDWTSMFGAETCQFSYKACLQLLLFSLTACSTVRSNVFLHTRVVLRMMLADSALFNGKMHLGSFIRSDNELARDEIVQSFSHWFESAFNNSTKITPMDRANAINRYEANWSLHKLGECSIPFVLSKFINTTRQ